MSLIILGWLHVEVVIFLYLLNMQLNLILLFLMWILRYFELPMLTDIIIFSLFSNYIKIPTIALERIQCLGFFRIHACGNKYYQWHLFQGIKTIDIYNLKLFLLETHLFFHSFFISSGNYICTSRLCKLWQTEFCQPIQGKSQQLT